MGVEEKPSHSSRGISGHIRYPVVPLLVAFYEGCTVAPATGPPAEGRDVAPIPPANPKPPRIRVPAPMGRDVAPPPNARPPIPPPPELVPSFRARRVVVPSVFIVLRRIHTSGVFTLTRLLI
jgi:hypothetical protein